MNNFNYWLLVRDCLVNFHAFHPTYADSAVFKHLARLNSQELIEIASHEEAFYLGCRLGGEETREPREDEEQIYKGLILKYES
jgi:hypothetical protein